MKYFIYSKRLNFLKLLKIKKKILKKAPKRKKNSKYFIFYKNKSTFSKLILKYFSKKIKNIKYFKSVPPKYFFRRINLKKNLKNFFNLNLSKKINNFFLRKSYLFKIFKKFAF